MLINDTLVYKHMCLKAKLGLNFEKRFYLKAFLGVIRCGEIEKTGFESGRSTLDPNLTPFKSPLRLISNVLRKKALKTHFFVISI